jgi:hypothetical protein
MLLVCITHKNEIRTSDRTKCVCTVKTNELTMLTEVMAVLLYHYKHINTPGGQNAEFYLTLTEVAEHTVL